MKTMWSMRSVLGVAAVMFVLCCGAGCGSSVGNSASSSSTGDTVNITGTVYAPSGLTGNVSVKGVGGRKAVTESAATGLTCALFTFEGEHVGSATSGSDGSFTIQASVATLRPAGGSASWSERVAVRCRNADGSIEVQTYAEISVIEGTTASVSVGDLTSVTTQATLAVRRVLGCDWSAAACSVPAATDLSCLFAAQRALFDEADGNDDGVEQAAGEILRVMNGLQAAGVSLEAIGYDSLADFTLALRSGAVESARLESIAAAVASLLELDASVIVTRLQSAAALLNATDTVLGQTIAGAVGQTTLASGATFCAEAEADDAVMEALLAPVLAATSVEDLTETYSEAGAWAVIASVVTTAADAGTLADLREALDDLDAYLALYNGDFSTVYVDGAVDGTTIIGLLGVMADQDAAASTTEQREFMEGWQRLIVADGGWTEFVADGSYNDEMADFVCANFYDDSFDPDTFDFLEFTETIDAVDASVTGSTCDELSTYEERLACYDQSVGDVEGGEMVDGAGDPAPADAPTVLTFVPADGGSVAWSHSLSLAATFSADMDASSLTSEVFTFEAIDSQGTVMRRILGTVAYDATRREAVFTPSDIYEVYSGQTYRAALAASITDAVGTSLGVPYSWTFTVTY
ncbi:MAG: Ig-like domain-containing protein [Deltaproteobacteria bacterium]|nr:Ig-like domain-containing protein [Deltaproteobacteria bacterium]